MHHGDHDDGQDPKEQINYKAAFGLLSRLVLERKGPFAVAALYMTAATLLSLLIPVITKYIIDTALPAMNARGLLAAVGGYLGVTLLYLYFNYLQVAQLARAGQDTIVHLKRRLLRHMLSQDLEFYSATPVGRLTARVQSDTSTLYALFTNTVITILNDVLMFCVAFGVMFHFNRRLSMVLLPVFPVLVLMGWGYARITSPMFVKVRKLAAEVPGFLTEQLNGIGVLQAFSREADASAKMEDLNKRKFSAEIRVELYGVVFFTSIVALQPIATAGIFGYGGTQVLAGKMTVGVVVMFLLYLGYLFEPIFRLSDHLSVIQRSFSAGHRIAKILAMKPRLTDPEKPHYLTSVREAIEFRNVWMRYKEDSAWVLKDVSFRLPRGQSLAILGETGGGKTTVTSLLFRFYDFQKGHIEIDGTDLRKVSLGSLRQAIGLVQQDIYLFPGTVMDNLKLMDASIPDSRVHDAIRTMGLDGFFKKHPLDKKVQEKGANLSIGEKQVISLARAMVLDQEVLVLDEATSNMDPHTERAITGAIKSLIKHKTVIVIAHRLSTVRSADRIMMISGGEVKELGTHDELLARDGLYAKYYRLQFGEAA